MESDRPREPARGRSRPAFGSCFRTVLVWGVVFLWAVSGCGFGSRLRVAAFNVADGLGASGTESYESVALILERIGADIVGLQELRSDGSNLAALGARLGLSHRESLDESYLHVGLLSRYPIAEHYWIWGWGMTRDILLARIEAPGTERKIWVAVLHLKCCNEGGTESATRAWELQNLREALEAYCDVANDLILLMGDFNLVAPGEDADDFFVAQQIFKLDARHAGPGGESWTWRGSRFFPPGALDHIMVNEAARGLGVESEVYDVRKDAEGIDGLPKYGVRPLPGASYGSDHLPIFADMDVMEFPDFLMDGNPDSEFYTLSGFGITLQAAVRGTRLYVATRSTSNQAGGNDHHILIADNLLETASANAPWAKRGRIAIAESQPFLAAEGTNDYAGWFNTGNSSLLRKSPDASGVLEGSIDLVKEFGRIPEFLYMAAVAYETSDASVSNPSFGRVVGQAPAPAILDDDMGPDEFLRVPVRSITDSVGDGRFDLQVPGRGFTANLESQTNGLALRWKSIPGNRYRIWHRERLGVGSWQDRGEETAGPRDWEVVVPLEGVESGRASGFYRIELLEP
jgi:endonuclease/exonuclease/phosphatase family metal-dependent hydrolase